MVALITAVHIIVCAFLIIVVLLQSGQSGDVAAAFGGMGSQTAFGTRTAATVLTKATTWAAIIFMLTSITLSVFAARRSLPHRLSTGRHHDRAGQVGTSPGSGAQVTRHLPDLKLARICQA